MRLRTGLWRSSHYFREIVQDDDLYYSVMATEIPLKVSYCQQTALYLSCPVIILSPHFHLKEMSGYYKLCHLRRHPLLQTLLPLSAGGFLRTRTRRPCRPTGTGGLDEIKIRSALDPIGGSPFLHSWKLLKVELFSAFISHLDDISSWKCSLKCKSLQFKKKKLTRKRVGFEPAT